MGNKIKWLSAILVLVENIVLLISLPNVTGDWFVRFDGAWFEAFVILVVNSFFMMTILGIVWNEFYELEERVKKLEEKLA